MTDRIECEACKKNVAVRQLGANGEAIVSEHKDRSRKRCPGSGKFVLTKK